MAVIRQILYADRDGEARVLIKELLVPHELLLAESVGQARILARQHSFDIYIVASGGGSTEIDLCEWLHRIDPRTPIIFCSSMPSMRQEKAAIAAGALRYHVKPVDPHVLLGTVDVLIKLAQFESMRAGAAAQRAIVEELGRQPSSAGEIAAAARETAEESRDRRLLFKAYRAFKDAGGNRANFERQWPKLIASSRRDTADLG